MILCRLGLHRSDVIKDTGCHRYRVCRHCGKRAIVGGRLDGYQPIDRGWLATGEWTKIGPPPRMVPPPGAVIERWVTGDDGVARRVAMIQGAE